MNILWITLESILPANSGGRLGVFKRLEQLAQNNNIYLFYPYDSDDEIAYVRELKEYCSEVYPYKRKGFKQCGVDLFKYPYTVASRNIDKMKKDIMKCIRKNNIDVINVDFPHMCVALLELNTDIPIVLNEHNIEWKVYRTISKSQKSIIKKMAYYIDSYRLKSFEKNIFQRLPIKRVTFVSDKDRKYMNDIGMVPFDRSDLVPVGADTQNFEKYDCKNGNNIVFVGKMSYGPNIEAVKWFAQDIFPEIKAKVPDAKFYIVGKSPIADIIALQNKDIIVTGMVESVEDYYKLADLVVLPLKNGGGVKVKLLEAISYNKPIVSTSVGVEGTYYSEHYIPVADNKIDFTKQCINILQGNNSYQFDNIYTYFLQNYTWKEIGKSYSKILEDVKYEPI